MLQLLNMLFWLEPVLIEMVGKDRVSATIVRLASEQGTAYIFPQVSQPSSAAFL